MNPMNPEWKAKWLKALRSGEYRQGTSLLNGPRGFCCLGVLCDIVAKEYDTIVVGSVDADPNFSPIAYTTYDFCGTGLPKSITKITGVQAMGQFNPGYEKKPKYPSPFLANLNDMGWSFEQIANVIEKEM